MGAKIIDLVTMDVRLLEVKIRQAHFNRHFSEEKARETSERAVSKALDIQAFARSKPKRVRKPKQGVA